MIELAKLKVGKTPLRTRSGLKVQCWRIQKDIPDTFFPIRAIIEHPDGMTEEIAYNYNGRRYINVESDYDLMVAQRKSKRRRVEPWPYDCVPDPMRAIAYIRSGEIDKVRLANKSYSTPTTKGAITNIEIGYTE